MVIFGSPCQEFIDGKDWLDISSDQCVKKLPSQVVQRDLVEWVAYARTAVAETQGQLRKQAAVGLPEDNEINRYQSKFCL